MALSLSLSLLMVDLMYSPYYVVVILPIVLRFCYNSHWYLSAYILIDNLRPLYFESFAICLVNIQFTMTITSIPCRNNGLGQQRAKPCRRVNGAAKPCRTWEAVGGKGERDKSGSGNLAASQNSFPPTTHLLGVCVKVYFYSSIE